MKTHVHHVSGDASYALKQAGATMIDLYDMDDLPEDALPEVEIQFPEGTIEDGEDYILPSGARIQFTWQGNAIWAVEA